MSLDAGRAITKLPAVETMAGGVEGGIGALTFGVLGPLVDRVALVTEDEILEGVRWMLANHQYLIEPTAAVAVAACLTGKIGTLTRARSRGHLGTQCERRKREENPVQFLTLDANPSANSTIWR